MIHTADLCSNHHQFHYNQLILNYILLTPGLWPCVRSAGDHPRLRGRLLSRGVQASGGRLDLDRHHRRHLPRRRPPHHHCVQVIEYIKKRYHREKFIIKFSSSLLSRPAPRRGRAIPATSYCSPLCPSVKAGVLVRPSISCHTVSFNLVKQN